MEQMQKKLPWQLWALLALTVGPMGVQLGGVGIGGVLYGGSSLFFDPLPYMQLPMPLPLAQALSLASRLLEAVATLLGIVGVGWLYTRSNARVLEAAGWVQLVGGLLWLVLFPQLSSMSTALGGLGVIWLARQPSVSQWREHPPVPTPVQGGAEDEEEDEDEEEGPPFYRCLWFWAPAAYLVWGGWLLAFREDRALVSLVSIFCLAGLVLGAVGIYARLKSMRSGMVTVLCLICTGLGFATVMLLMMGSIAAISIGGASMFLFSLHLGWGLVAVVGNFFLGQYRWQKPRDLPK